MFQNIGEVVQFGEDAESIRSGPLYRISRLNPLIMLPSKGWYLQTPTFVSVIAPLFMAGFAMLTTVSGRSAALGAIGFAAIVLIGGKTRRSIHKISRHFGLVVFCGIVLIGVVYVGYKVSASQGLLGAKAQAKYEQQSHGGEGGIGRLLLGGRMDSFVGFLACRDKPIVGWGPWPVDTNGYTEEFLSRFGTYEDVITLQKANESARLYGYRTGLIQCHAYITEFWVWYGIFGLLFWVYVIFVMLRYLKEDVAAVPQWFAWLACSIPGMFWGIFFSPFADRFGVPLFVVACLMARSVRKGLVQLPLEMIVEIEKAERK